MNVPEIKEVKDLLDSLKHKGLVKTWELPYENLLTRRTAAIFFIEPADESTLKDIDIELQKFPDFSYRSNSERKLSSLSMRATFNKEEKEKNQTRS
ncbi:MAG: hypothetical protein DI539_09405 [Flavobacterium psychrophilum]|jgi:hypothetical protein|nr:MAG: hypothetical protein DI539_09405 [Flavobacterium psychrophilum]